ncbi:MAG: allantoate amidohydrolase [Nocardioidaceae bacterium]
MVYSDSTTFGSLWETLEPIGRDAGTGGYVRLAYDDAELTCREWFTDAATRIGLDVERDRNGNLWAWWVGPWGGPDDADALVLGSHLDSVRHGGAYDGPLGVVSSLAVIESARARGFEPNRPVAVAAFADEEGARFGVACAGSSLMTGSLDPDRARGLSDVAGITLAEAMQRCGYRPEDLGSDPERLARIGTFVELHIEQGKQLAYDGESTALATSIWPHGRYRFTFSGEPNHAGTTRMSERRDPLHAFARTVVSIGEDTAAEDRATFGRVEVAPNSTNVIPAEVRAWLDARAEDEPSLERLVEQVRARSRQHARDTATRVEVHPESVSPEVVFDAELSGRLSRVAATTSAAAPMPAIPTCAGHDAGVLSRAGVPTAMLFVRNPTGISHSPEEHAEWDDCVDGARTLGRIFESLAG